MTTFACTNTYPDQTLSKNPVGGFTWSLGGWDHFTMHFDAAGVYLYQYQEDLIDGGPPYKCIINNVEPLTANQMQNAFDPK